MQILAIDHNLAFSRLQLRGNQAFAGIERDAQPAFGMFLGVMQQPLCAARLGILGQTADSQLSL